MQVQSGFNHKQIDGKWSLLEMSITDRADRRRDPTLLLFDEAGLRGLSRNKKKILVYILQHILYDNYEY